MANPTLQEILDSEIFKETVAEVRADLVKQVMATDWDDTQHRDAMAEHNAIDRVLKRLKSKKVNNGK